MLITATNALFYYTDPTRSPHKHKHLLVSGEQKYCPSENFIQSTSNLKLSVKNKSSFPFKATNQTDLENWVTAIHSASASLLAKRQGKEDTLRLLRCQSRSLLHKIDMDGKMKKMAELQLSVIKEQKNRKAVESQVSPSEFLLICDTQKKIIRFGWHRS